MHLIDDGYDNINIITSYKEEMADNGKQYKKTFQYLDNSITVNIPAEAAILSASSRARKVYIYIISHLKRYDNELLVKRNDVKEFLNCNDNFVSLGLKELIDIGIIKQTKTITGYEDYDKDSYTLMPYAVCKGSITEIFKRLEKQRRENYEIEQNKKDNKQIQIIINHGKDRSKV